MFKMILASVVALSFSAFASEPAKDAKETTTTHEATTETAPDGKMKKETKMEKKEHKKKEHKGH